MVKRLHHNVIDAEILLGSHRDKQVLIPQLVLAPSDMDLPFVLRCLQFPLRLAWAMTRSKAQGQTFEKVDIHLDEPVFTHAQLYIAFLSATFACKSFQYHIKEDMMTYEQQTTLLFGAFPDNFVNSLDPRVSVYFRILSYILPRVSGFQTPPHTSVFTSGYFHV